MDPIKFVKRPAVFGYGLFAVQKISKGEKIVSFDGDFVLWDSVEQIPDDPEQGELQSHCIQIGPGVSRDSKSDARYANHSCAPNAGIQNYYDLVAMRDIEAGEEITWDYAMTENNSWSMTCDCGSAKYGVPCRQEMTGYDSLPEERRAAYAGFISEWQTGGKKGLQDAYAALKSGVGVKDFRSPQSPLLPMPWV